VLQAELARLQGLDDENRSLKDALRTAEQKLQQAMVSKCGTFFSWPKREEILTWHCYLCLQDVITKLRDEVEALRADAAGQYAKLRAEVERITGVKMEIEGDLSNEKQVNFTPQFHPNSTPI